MKNLKRVLSLALATVMLLGVMVVGSNAAFSDQSSINYTQAVDTLVGLDVISGMGQNQFQPNGTLTRAQGARLVALVKAGSNETTLGYYAGTTKFTDVKTNHSWAEGSINYCVSLGIIAGQTATTFNPDGQLTGAALAKMMLIALGFSGSTSDSTTTLTGPNWQLNAIRMANENGLFDGLNSSFAATKPITRQEACQIMFNALDTNIWEIDGKNSNGDYNYTNKGTPTLIEKCYAATANKTATDNFGRPATEYSFKDGRDAVKIAKSATKTYTTEVTGGTIYADLGLSATAKASTQEDGESAVEKDIAKNDKKVKFGGNGAVTEVFYDREAKTIKIVTVNTYVAKVNAPVAAKNGNEAYITLTKLSGSATASDRFETTAFAKDDVVLYTYIASKGIQSVEKAPSVVGVFNSYTAEKSMVVGGKTYSYSAQVATKAEAYGGALKDEVTVYTDNYGYAIHMETYKASGETVYAYVEDTGKGGELFNTADYAKLVLADGTVKAVQTKEDYESLKGKLVTYSSDADGVHTLTVAATQTAVENKATEIVKGKSAFTAGSTTYYANSKTVFIVMTMENGKPVYTAYTGIANMPSMKGDTVSGQIVVKDGVAAAVYLTGATQTSTKKDLIFVYYDKDVKITKTSDRGNFFTYKAVVNGQVVDLDVAVAEDGTSSTVTATALYDTVTYDKNNVATLSGEITDKTATGTKATANGVVGLGSEFYSYTSDCVVAVIEDGELTLISVENIGEDANDTVVFQVNDDGAVTGVFITKVTDKG
ncbi:MAG: S-layer homology domain-containing protein [Oscillospiraceae bacterium]|nr:S-layer homology domain-containing protein [Oscillospiraceae bacterium]